MNKLGNPISNIAGEIGKAAADASKKIGDNLPKIDIKKIDEVRSNVSNNVQHIVANTSSAVVEKTNQTARSINKAMDVNGDGKVDIEDIIIAGLSIPGIGIKRDEFLQHEFMKDFPQETIDDAIEYSPAHAGITPKEIEKYANAVIQYERNCVSGISAALSTPGGFAMVATIPADIIQYYGYMLRAIQKLLYLYGFPEINVQEKGNQLDTETMNILILCFGVMFGVAGANNTLKTVAKMLGNGVQKQLMKKALTKGTVYPIVKKTAKWFGVKMTKEVFAGFFKKAIPVVGGVIGGGLTYLSFKPCCDKLKESLQDTYISTVESKEIENSEEKQ